MGDHFNTSHVTVYRDPAWSLSFDKLYFNTSHVTVYLNPFTEELEIM